MGGAVGVGIVRTPIGWGAEYDVIGGSDENVSAAVSEGEGESAMDEVGVERVGGIGSGTSAYVVKAKLITLKEIVPTMSARYEVRRPPNDRTRRVRRPFNGRVRGIR